MVTTDQNTAFRGAKLALFIGDRIVVMLRDEKPDIPWPGYWDFPGGGCEAGETPEQCVIRETEEELSLSLKPQDLTWKRSFQNDARPPVWFFAAHLDAEEADNIMLGDEGQRWQLMEAGAYLAHPRAIPHFAERLRIYLRQKGA